MVDEANIGNDFVIVEKTECLNSEFKMSSETAHASNKQGIGESVESSQCRNTETLKNDLKQSSQLDGKKPSDVIGAGLSSNPKVNKKAEDDKGPPNTDGKEFNDVLLSVATSVSESKQENVFEDKDKGPLRFDGKEVKASFGTASSVLENRQENVKGDTLDTTSPGVGSSDSDSSSEKYYPPTDKESTLNNISDEDSCGGTETMTVSAERPKKDSGAIPKVKSFSAIAEKRWKKLSLVICICTGKSSDSKIVENQDATSDLDPLRMQYLIQFHFKDIEHTLLVEMKRLNLTMKKLWYNTESVTIDIAETYEQTIMDDLVTCLQDEVNKVSFKSFPVSRADRSEVVLKEYLKKGELGLYCDEEKIYIVGTTSDLNQITQKLPNTKHTNKNETDTKRRLVKTYKFEFDVQVQIFRNLGLEEHLKSKCPSIAVRFDQDSRIAEIEGDDNSLIDKAIKRIEKFSKSIKSEEHNDPLLIQFLGLPEIEIKVTSLIKEKHLFLSWTATQTNCKITFYYRKKPDFDKFNDLFEDMFLRLKFPVISDTKEILFATTKEFVDLVDQHNGIDMIIRQEGNNYRLLATKDIATMLLMLEQKFKTTIQDKSPTTSQNQPPTSIQNQPPAAIQNQPPAAIQKLSLTSIQNPSIATIQNQFPTSNQNQSTTNIQEKFPQKDSLLISPMAKSIKKEQGNGQKLHDKLEVYMEKVDFHELQILKTFGFKSRCPHFELLEDEIKYSGNKDHLEEEIQNFKAQHLHAERIKNLPNAVYEFYETDCIKHFVNSSLDKKKIACYWYVDLKEMMIQVYTSDKLSLPSVVAEIKNCVHFSEYTSTEDNLKALKTQGLDNFLKAKEPYIKILDDKSDEFLVVGVTPLMKEFEQMFGKIVMSNVPSFTQSTAHGKYSLGIDSAVLNYIHLFSSANLTEFLNSFKVEISVENEEVFVNGNFQNAEAAAKEFAKHKFISRKWSCLVSNPALIIEKLQPTMQHLQEKFQCFLKVESDARIINQQQLAQWINWENRQHLVLVHGCVGEMAADVIVCPSAYTYEPTKIGQSIIDRGGLFVKEDFTKRVAQKDAVYISSETGDLSCIMVAHTAVPKVEGDMKKKMVSFLQELLSHIDKTTQLQSIVIPTMMANEITETTLIHWFIEAFKRIKNKLSNLKQIYLCSEDPDNAENAVEVLSKGLAGEDVCFYDFKHMFEHPANVLTRKRKPARICVNLVEGSLIDQKVDVIVNSCGTDLNLGKGNISALILKAAGPTIADECMKEYPYGVEFGEVVHTSAGRLKFKLICHGALPNWTPSACFSSKILEKLVFDCLVMAEEGKCKTIAFPVFGTGNLLYPWDNVAETMIEAVNKFSRLYLETVVQEVRIVLYEKDIKSIEAFSSRKLMMEKLQIIEEDPKPAPSLILESRCKNVRVRVVPQSELRFHHCDAQVVIYSFEQTHHEDPNSMLRVDGIDCEKSTGINYWNIKVFSDEQEKNYQDAIKKVFSFSEEQRLSSVAICLMHEKGVPMLPLKKQITLVRNYVSSLTKIRYLQVVKLVVLKRDMFDTIIAETISKQEAEVKQWTYASIVAGLFTQQKNHWKIMRHCNTTEVSKMLVHAAGIEEQSIRDMLDKLVQKVESVVKKDNNYFGGSIKHNAGLETDKDNIWVRTEEQSTGQKIIPLPGFMFNKLDETAKSGIQATEIVDGNNVYVFNFDNFTYFINNTFDGTSGRFYKYGGPGDPSQAPDTAKEQKKDKYKRQTSTDEAFEEVYGDVSKKLFEHVKMQILAKIIQEQFLNVELMPITTDTLTFKFKTVKLLQDVNHFLKKKYNIPGDCLHKSERQTTAPPRKKKNSSSSDDSLPPSSSEVKVKMTKERFDKLKFFIKDNILRSQITHDGNQLILKVKSPKDYKKCEEMITQEIAYVDQMSQVDIPLEKQLKMEDIEHFMATDFSSILCRIVGDVVQLSGPSYDKLMQAKHRIEIVMGSKQETKGRRERRFADPVDQYKRDTKADSDSSYMHSNTASQSKSQSYSPSSATVISMMQVYTTTEGITVKVYNGNILKLDVDCIVNAANESLSHGGGVAAVISGAAGYQLDQECDDYIKQKGKLAVGECCSTSAGKLNYKNVIHTVGPRWGDYKFDEKKKCAGDLKKSIICSFEEAEHLNLKSIAIPSISAGIFGVPKEVCVAEYGNSVIEFSQSRKSGTCLKEIHFVDKDFGLVSLIQNEFNKIFQPSAQQNSGLPAKGSGRHNFQRPLSSGSGNNSFQKGSSLGGSRSINQTAQFEVKNSLKIYVKIGNITKCEVDAIACPQDEFKIHRGAIAKEVEKIGGYEYEKLFAKIHLTKYGSKRMPAPSNCPFKYVIQTVPPRWNLEAQRNNQAFERNLKETVFNILNEAKYGKIKTVAIPLMGIAEKGYDTPVKTFAEQFMKGVFQQFEYKDFSGEEIHVVVHDIPTVTTIIDVFTLMENQGVKRLEPPVERQSGGQSEEPMEVEVYGKANENCCICMDKLMKPKKLACGHTFCTECIEKHFKYKPSCPQCGAIHGTVTGTQPKGTMKKRINKYSLPGFHGTDTIEIEYRIFSGKQGEEHPNPGTPFEGISRTAFLPDNRKGRLIARLLEVAFNRRLIFTIGTSNTTGKTGVVTWNDIHHKTNSKPNTQFGYPDDGYFDRVLEELAVKGVTEKDLKD